MAQSEISIQLTTVTWVWLAIQLFCWLKSKRLLKMLNNAIYARTYINGKLSHEYRLDFNKLNIDKYL